MIHNYLVIFNFRWANTDVLKQAYQGTEKCHQHTARGHQPQEKDEDALIFLVLQGGGRQLGPHVLNAVLQPGRG